MPTPSTFGERLFVGMAHANLSDEALATKLRMTRGGVNHWLHGRRAPGGNKVETIASILGIRAAWLAFGDGPMVDDAPPSTPPPPPKRRTSIPPPAAKKRSAPKRKTPAKPGPARSKPRGATIEVDRAS